MWTIYCLEEFTVHRHLPFLLSKPANLRFLPSLLAHSLPLTLYYFYVAVTKTPESKT
jgi:hypothetical protein